MNKCVSAVNATDIALHHIRKFNLNANVYEDRSAQTTLRNLSQDMFPNVPQPLWQEGKRLAHHFVYQDQP